MKKKLIMIIALFLSGFIGLMIYGAAKLSTALENDIFDLGEDEDEEI